LIKCAKKFQLEGVRLLCAQFMEEGVTVENACTLFERAHSLLHAKQFALQFIEENAHDVVQSPGFDLLPKDRVMDILRSSRLSIDEIDLFNGVLRWAVHECKRQKVDVSAENKKQVLKDILPLIRFPIMGMEEIATYVSPSQMLDSKQLLEIFTYLGQPDKTKKTSFNTNHRTGAVDKWTLDEQYKSSTIILSDKNMSCRCTASGHSYVLGTASWSRGQHAWRVTRMNGNTQWLMLGVSTRMAYSDSSYSQAGVYAVSSASQRYFNGNSTSMPTNFTSPAMDVLLDCDKGLCVVVNCATGARFELPDIPKNTANVAHFGPHSPQQFTIQAIRPRDVGKMKST